MILVLPLLNFVPFRSVPQSIIIHTNNYILRNGTEQEYLNCFQFPEASSKEKVLGSQTFPDVCVCTAPLVRRFVRMFIYVCVCLGYFMNNIFVPS